MERAETTGTDHMGAKVSAEMKHALFLVVQEGKSVKQSAKIAGVDASSVYKALRRMESNDARAGQTDRSGVVPSDAVSEKNY
jgi:transposase